MFIEHIRPDGTILYRTYLGGGGFENAAGIALDPAGNIYVAGNTASNDFPVTAAAFGRSCGAAPGQQPEEDGFVVKLSPDGRSVIFATCLGGSGLDQLAAIAVDAFGRAHVVGFTDSPDYPVTAGAVRTTRQNSEAIYSRISADGSVLEYSTLLGGSQNEEAFGVAVDDAGNAYVTGFTGSPDFPLQRPLQSAFRAVGATAFLAKFTGAGLDFSTFLGGSGDDEGRAIGVTSNAIYVGGFTNSLDFPGAPRPSNKDWAGFIAAVTLDGSALERTALLDGTGADVLEALTVSRSDIVYAGGITYSTDFPFSSDAPQKANNGGGDNFVAVVPMVGASAGKITWSSYLGGSSEDHVDSVTVDGAGGFMIGGYGSLDYPMVNGSTPQTNGSAATLAHFAAPIPENIVLYAKDVSRVVGNWQLVSDPTAAGGMRIWNPDAGAAKIATAATSPANYVEFTFNAWAGVPYHLWIRMKADNDSFQNDSVFVQFNDSVAVGGSPHWLIGTTGATVVSLEDCSGCGEQGWGWNDNGYDTAGENVTFAFTGQHTIRIQQREDGVSIDQIVLSSANYLSSAPGTNKNDTTIVPQGGTSNQPPTVSIATPSNGATFTAPADITVSGTATDSDGTIARVDIYINGELKASGPPGGSAFSASWFGLPAGTYTFTVVATDNQGASTRSAPVTVTVSANTSGDLQGLKDADVGATGAAGSASFANGTFTLKGAGADVWGTADAFNYAYMPMTGDVRIVARVATVSSEANWVKAGVMIRGSLWESSAQAFMLVSHAKGVAFQRRTANAATTVSTSGTASTAPHWVSLLRSGATISAYESADGSNWTLVGSDTFAASDMPDTVLVGLAVSSHVAGTLATATFDNVSITAARPPPPPSGDQCSSVTLSQTSFYSGGPASNWQFTVTAPSASCTWTASIDQPWLLLDGTAGPTTISGTGSGTVTLQTTDNRTGANRFGTFTIGGTAYKVTQEPF